MGTAFQIILLLIQAFPSVLKAIQVWREQHQAELNNANRAKLAQDIRTTVATAIANKSTVGLEDMIKNLGKPSTIPSSTDTPSS